MTNNASATAEPHHKDHGKGAEEGLGFAPNSVVQEFYYDDDVDENIRAAIEKFIGGELVDEDYGDVTDGALVWWRHDDGEADDLADLLVDAAGNLDNGGLIWVLTPTGVPHAVDTQFVEEAAQTAGIRAMSSSHVSSGWLGIRLMARPSDR